MLPTVLEESSQRFGRYGSFSGDASSDTESLDRRESFTSEDDSSKAERRSRNRKNRQNLTEFFSRKDDPNFGRRHPSYLNSAPIANQNFFNAEPLGGFDDSFSPSTPMAPLQQARAPASLSQSSAHQQQQQQASSTTMASTANTTASTSAVPESKSAKNFQYIERLRVANAMMEERILSKNEFQELKNKIVNDMFGVDTVGSSSGTTRATNPTNLETSCAIQPSAHRMISRNLTNEVPVPQIGLYTGQIPVVLVDDWRRFASTLGLPIIPQPITLAALRENWDVTRAGLGHRYFPTGKEMMPVADLVQFLKQQQYRDVPMKNIVPIIQRVCGDNTKLLTSKQFDSLVISLRLATLIEHSNTSQAPTVQSKGFGSIDYSDDGGCFPLDLTMRENDPFFFDRNSSERPSEFRVVLANQINQTHCLKLMLRYRLHPVAVSEILSPHSLTPSIRHFVDDSSKHFLLNLPMFHLSSEGPMFRCSQTSVVILPNFESTLLFFHSSVHDFNPTHPHLMVSTAASLGSNSGNSAIRHSFAQQQKQKGSFRNKFGKNDRSRIAVAQPRTSLQGGSAAALQEPQIADSGTDRVLAFLSAFKDTPFHSSIDKLVWNDMKGQRDNGFLLCDVLGSVVSNISQVVDNLEASLESLEMELEAVLETKSLVHAIRYHTTHLSEMLHKLLNDNEILSDRYHPYYQLVADRLQNAHLRCEHMLVSVDGLERQHTVLVNQRKVLTGNIVTVSVLVILLLLIIVIIVVA
eukprot:c3289_g1_i1.p1 GENE.c3289_g1_i1~~c3289_g1_i1.p1  ORF type:complete len:750 (+),score=154.56 c3289_g1_i1:52-2301(+)